MRVHCDLSNGDLEKVNLRLLINSDYIIKIKGLGPLETSECP